MVICVKRLIQNERAFVLLRRAALCSRSQAGWLWNRLLSGFITKKGKTRNQMRHICNLSSRTSFPGLRYCHSSVTMREKKKQRRDDCHLQRGIAMNEEASKRLAAMNAAWQRYAKAVEQDLDTIPREALRHDY